jgi:rhodanese-related sulfurtransferase
MTPQQAHDQRDALQLLDVREADELVLARFPGAIHIPMDQVADRLHELDRTTPVAVICRSGNRSTQVTDFLNELGYSASNVDGGLRQWIRAGLPLHT